MIDKRFFKSLPFFSEMPQKEVIGQRILIVNLNVTVSEVDHSSKFNLFADDKKML